MCVLTDMRRRRVAHFPLARLGAAICLVAFVQPAPAQSDKQSAENAAGRFLAAFDVEDLGETYQRRLSPTFKVLMAEPVFVQQSGLMRIQFGGPAQARGLEGSQPFSQMPNRPQGSFYYVRYREKCPNGFIFQDLHLEKIDSDWKISGYYVFPVPPPPT